MLLGGDGGPEISSPSNVPLPLLSEANSAKVRVSVVPPRRLQVPRTGSGRGEWPRVMLMQTAACLVSFSEELHGLAQGPIARMGGGDQIVGKADLRIVSAQRVKGLKCLARPRIPKRKMGSSLLVALDCCLSVSGTSVPVASRDTAD